MRAHRRSTGGSQRPYTVVGDNGGMTATAPIQFTQSTVSAPAPAVFVLATDDGRPPPARGFSVLLPEVTLPSRTRVVESDAEAAP
jgi:hypothetical protein